jgi:RNA polymerase sigma-70 factor (ECF subfamily)
MQNGSNKRSDEEIVRQVIEGDTNAFGYLLERYRDYVFSIVMKQIPEYNTEEIAHDVFVRAYQSLPTYRFKGDFSHWLSKIAVRTCYDFLRKKYRSREQPLSSLTEDQLYWIDRVTSDRTGNAFDDETAHRDARDVLRWAMERLSPEERTVLELVHIEERPVREAAELLGWSTANVKIRAFRSRKKLRKILEKLL